MSAARTGSKAVSATARPRPLRADARRNIDAILEAATTCLARDPDASLGDIAKHAGVGRVTLYGHFDSRAALIATVMDRAIAEADAALEGTDLSGEPADALVRLIEATWPTTHRYGALIVAAERVLDADVVMSAHAGPMQRAKGLLERGRTEGSFRDDLPLEWLVNLFHTLTHAVAGAVYRGEITEHDAPRMIVATMLGTLTPPGKPVPHVCAGKDDGFPHVEVARPPT